MMIKAKKLHISTLPPPENKNAKKVVYLEDIEVYEIEMEEIEMEDVDLEVIPHTLPSIKMYPIDTEVIPES